MRGIEALERRARWKLEFQRITLLCGEEIVGNQMWVPKKSSVATVKVQARAHSGQGWGEGGGDEEKWADLGSSLQVKPIVLVDGSDIYVHQLIYSLR